MYCNKSNRVLVNCISFHGYICILRSRMSMLLQYTRHTGWPANSIIIYQMNWVSAIMYKIPCLFMYSKITDANTIAIN